MDARHGRRIPSAVPGLGNALFGRALEGDDEARTPYLRWFFWGGLGGAARLRNAAVLALVLPYRRESGDAADPHTGYRLRLF